MPGWLASILLNLAVKFGPPILQTALSVLTAWLARLAEKQKDESTAKRTLGGVLEATVARVIMEMEQRNDLKTWDQYLTTGVQMAIELLAAEGIRVGVTDVLIPLELKYEEMKARGLVRGKS